MGVLPSVYTNEVVKIAAKAVTGISVLTTKWLSCQGDPIFGHPHAANHQKIFFYTTKMTNLIL